MTKRNTPELFDFIKQRVADLANEEGVKPFHAFPLWFSRMYFAQPEQVMAVDGAGDGKIDLFFRTIGGGEVSYHVLNSKYTSIEKQTAPVQFYDEVISFHALFERREGRGEFLEKKVRADLRPHYRQLFDAYDKGKTQLIFLTNCRTNGGQVKRIEKLSVTTFHLEELVQHVLDDLDGAMPRTPDLVLRKIGTSLSPDVEESGLSTTIVFARLMDFVKYMEQDSHGLLFARNVRVYQGKTAVNQEIRRTFEDHPEQFVYSNNGVTVLCEEIHHDHGTRELTLMNPRVVNGSQTLHAVGAAAAAGRLSPDSDRARVMLRIVRIAGPQGDDGPDQAQYRKEIINRISIRTNQQNPIKPWNLRANDEFQMDVARRLRRGGWFYERRDKEWKERRADLKSVGISKGPSIKQMVAYLACYFRKHPKLGPTQAKGRLGELFQGEGYDYLSEKASAELAYQVAMVAECVRYALESLPPRRYAAPRRHIELVVITMVIKALGDAGATWGSTKLTPFFEAQWDDTSEDWISAAQAAADRVLERYDVAARRDDDLTLRNFALRRDEIGKIVEGTYPVALKSAAKGLIAVARSQ